jgi:hypothetical protein
LLVRRARLLPAAYSRESGAPEGTGAHKYAQIPFSNNNFSISASRCTHYTKISLFPSIVDSMSVCAFSAHKTLGAQGENKTNSRRRWQRCNRALRFSIQSISRQPDFITPPSD